LARYVWGGPLKNTQLQEVTPTHVIYRFKAHADAGQPTDLTVSGEDPKALTDFALMRKGSARL
jgi:hypothetical protein